MINYEVTIIQTNKRNPHTRKVEVRTSIKDLEKTELIASLYFAKFFKGYEVSNVLVTKPIVVAI